MAIKMRKLELRHLRHADTHEEAQHELRERLAYYTSVEVEPTELLLRRHGGRVSLPADGLLELLDRLDASEDAG